MANPHAGREQEMAAMAVAKQLGTVLHNSQEGKSGGGIEKADTIRSGSQRGPEDGAADVNDEDGDDDDDEEPEHWTKISLRHRSLFCLKGDHPVRKLAHSIAFNTWFEAFIIVVILANCLTMAVDDPTKHVYETAPGALDFSSFEAQAELFFNLVFLIELMIKTTAMGFCLHEGSYLRYPSSWLDFMVVSVGVIGYIDLGGNNLSFLSALRTIRVLRPLKALKGIDGMQTLIDAFVNSTPRLLNVLTLMVFLLSLFGLGSLQFFQGVLQGRCFDNSTMTVVDGGYGDVCSLQGVNYEGTPYVEGPRDPTTYACPDGLYCGLYQNPNWGITNYDNIGAAVLSIFVCITMEGWVDVMYALWDGRGWGVSIWFVFIILLGNFFMLGLLMAEISNGYETERMKAEEEKADARREIERAEKKARSAAAAEDMVAQAFVSGSGKPPGLDEAAGTVQDGDGVAYDEDGMRVFADPESTEAIEFRAAGPGTKLGPFMVVRPAEWWEVQADYTMNDGSPMFPRPTSLFQSVVRQIVMGAAFDVTILICILLNTVTLSCDFYDPVIFLESGGKHRMDPELNSVMMTANIALTWIFIVEMVLKVFALHPYGYKNDAFNIFDCVIVWISIVEMVVEETLKDSGAAVPGFFSVFRLFRVLRVFKMARSWKALNRLLGTLAMTVKGMSSFFILLFLLIFIFVLLGMQLFGGYYVFMDEEGGWYRPRNNFDNFWVGFITVFQVLTGENWNSVLFDGMHEENLRDPSNWGFFSVFYFVALTMLLNFVVLNLFLALLLGSFAASEKVHFDESAVESRKSMKAWVCDFAALDGQYLFDTLDAAAFHASEPAKAAERLGDSPASAFSDFYALRRDDRVSMTWDDLDAFARPAGPNGRAARLAAQEGSEIDRTADREEQDSEGNPSSDGEDSDEEEYTKEEFMSGQFGHTGVFVSGATPDDYVQIGPYVFSNNPFHSRTSSEMQGDQAIIDEKHARHNASKADAILAASARDQNKEEKINTPRGSSRSVGSTIGGGGGDAKVAPMPQSDTNQVEEASVEPKEEQEESTEPAAKEDGDKIVLSTRQHKMRSFPEDSRYSSHSRRGVSGHKSEITYDAPCSSTGCGCMGDQADEKIGLAHVTYAPGSACCGLCSMRRITLPVRYEEVDKGVANKLARRVMVFVDLEMHQMKWEQQIEDDKAELAAAAEGGQPGDVIETNRGVSPWGFGDHAMGCFPPSSPARQWFVRLVTNSHFDNFIYVLIIASSVILAMEDPVRRKDVSYMIFNRWINYFFVLVFLFEMLAKLVAYGFVTGTYVVPYQTKSDVVYGPYVSDGWNILDGCIVFISLIITGGDIFGVAGLERLSALRAMRALRPLRLLARSPGMKVVINSILKALPDIANTLGVVLLFWFIFAILGVQLFMGKLGSCNDGSREDIFACNGTFVDPDYHSDSYGEVIDREWGEYYMNFNRVDHAMMSLFETSTLEMWTDLMWLTIDTEGRKYGQAPLYIAGDNPWIDGDEGRCSSSREAAMRCAPLQKGLDSFGGFFFFFFIMVGSFLMVNLFTGTVIDNFNEQKGDDGKSVFLTKEQAEWVELNKLISLAQPERKVTMPIEGSGVCCDQLCWGGCYTDHNKKAHGGRLCCGTGCCLMLRQFVFVNIVNNRGPAREVSRREIEEAKEDAKLIAAEEAAAKRNAAALAKKQAKIQQQQESSVDSAPASAIEDDAKAVAAQGSADGSGHGKGSSDVAQEPVEARPKVVTASSATLPRNTSALGTSRPTSRGSGLSVRPSSRANKQNMVDAGSTKKLDVLAMSVRQRMQMLIEHHQEDVEPDYFLGGETVIDVFIMLAIVLNIVVMAVAHFEQSAEVTATLNTLSTIFTIIFALEASLKITAMGFPEYIYDNFNKFDFMIVCLSFLSFFDGINAGFVSILRIARLARLFRLLKSMPMLMATLRTLYNSMPAMANVVGLLAIFLAIFSIMGVQFFSGVTKRDPVTGEKQYGDYLTRHSNFNDFFYALLTLFRCSTGESWNGIMHDLDVYDQIPGASTLPGTAVCFAKNPSTGVYFCEEDGWGVGCAERECPVDAGIYAIVFFSLFTLVVSFVFLNMFIGVILDVMTAGEEDDEEEEGGFPIKSHHIEQYREAWDSMDNKGPHMREEKLARFLRKVQEPLGFRSKEGVAPPESFVKQYLFTDPEMNSLKLINLPNTPPEHLFFGFQDLLRLLCEKEVKSLGNSVMELPAGVLPEAEKKHGVLTQVLDLVGGRSEEVAISKYFAAEYVQQAYVKYLRRKKHAADFAAAKEAKVVKAGNPMAKSEQ